MLRNWYPFGTLGKYQDVWTLTKDDSLINYFKQDRGYLSMSVPRGPPKIVEVVLSLARVTAGFPERCKNAEKERELSNMNKISGRIG